MWEENHRKYPRDHPQQQQHPNGQMNGGYDPTEDLHAWSIYRQNLNADLSESAIGVGSKANNNAEKPFGNFQLKESTVNNILSHPKYGPSIKNHDPYTYLRFGLPRVKSSAAQSELGGRQMTSMQSNNHHGMTSDSEEESFVNRKRINHNNKARVWKSNPNLAESNFMPTNIQANNSKSVIGINGTNGTRPVSRIKSEMDLRNPVPNGFATGFGTKTSHMNGGANSVIGRSSSTAGQPHLIVRNLYYEVDRTPTSRRICGAQRQKLRILDNVSFEVKSGEILAIMATNGKCVKSQS